MTKNMEFLIETVIRLAPFLILGLVIGTKEAWSIPLIIGFISIGFALTIAMGFVAVLLASLLNLTVKRRKNKKLLTNPA